MNRQSDIDLQRIIGEAILHQESCVVLTKETRQYDVRNAIRIFMRNHPEIFWFSHQWRFDESSSTLYLKYNFTPHKKALYSQEINKAIASHFQPNQLTTLSEIEKVAYVYKWIVANTTYNEYSSFNQTIYSVLINRNSVCTGYAKTGQFLLGLLGVDSRLVFGKFRADKSEGGRHCWNIVKINGDWYHIDFCLADPVLRYLLNADETPDEYDGLLWNYFCKPTEYVLKNRSIEFVETYPQCLKSIEQRIDIKLTKPLAGLSVCKSESGTMSEVFLAPSDKDSVVKVARDNQSHIDNEAEILGRLQDCKHIVKLKGRRDGGLILEQLTPWGELLNSHYYHPNEHQLIDILIQLSDGLIECRDNGITYSDIHYNNIFVSKEGVYKWGDFGLAYPSSSDGSLPPHMIGDDGVALGSRWFMAPETYREGIFTESSAIYSLAMLGYFVMNDMRPPFLSDSTDEQGVLQRIHSGERIQIPSKANAFGALSRFVCGILNAGISNRTKCLEEFISSLRDIDVSAAMPVLVTTSEPLSGIDSDSVMAIDTDDSETATYDIDDGSAVDDCDFFASTLNSSDGSLIIEPDTDAFAQTCGMQTVSSAPLTDNSRDRQSMPGSAVKQSIERTTTYSPTKNSVEPQTRQSSGNGSGICGAVKSAVDFFKGMFAGKASNTTVPNDPERHDDINACVYAPAEVCCEKSFIIRVYMYLPYEQDLVDKKVKDIDPTAVKKEYRPLDLPVKMGDKLTVQLELSDGVQCKNPVKTVIWQNHYIDCSFFAKLVDDSQDSIEGTAYVFVNDIPAGEMLFTIDVVESARKEVFTKVESRRFSKIFISYAHQDETQVRGIAEGCRMLGKDYFFDRHRLQAGDIFKEKILNYIDEADLFVLCWSKNAAESEWVQIERKHALQVISEGKTKLSIYPLSLRPEAPLPTDMSDRFNFGTL